MTTPASYHPADPESVFTYGAPHLKFGHGAADEIGYDLSLTGARRVLVVTDPGVAATGLSAFTSGSADPGELLTHERPDHERGEGGD